MARRKRVKAGLSVGEFKRAMERVGKYRDSIQRKCELFVKTLGEKGIEVAKQNIGGYGNHVSFGVDIDPLDMGARGVMFAVNDSLIHVRWIGGGVSYGEADVSPLLMAEFGSGLRAQQNPRGPEFGMGTGTFPGQTHAFDPDGWWYMDMDGQWHHTHGVTPLMPMDHAHKEMLRQIRKTAREVFR